jgi:Gpi18-like mannosyltransferase
LIPAFLLVAWREKRPPLPYVAAFASAIGLFSFSLYCAIRFGDCLAFVHVPKGWEQPSWFDILSKALKGQISAISRIVMILVAAICCGFFPKGLPV